MQWAAEQRGSQLCMRKEFPDDRCRDQEPKNSCLGWRGVWRLLRSTKLTARGGKDVYDAENSEPGEVQSTLFYIPRQPDKRYRATRSDI